MLGGGDDIGFWQGTVGLGTGGSLVGMLFYLSTPPPKKKKKKSEKKIKWFEKFHIRMKQVTHFDLKNNNLQHTPYNTHIVSYHQVSCVDSI